MIKARMSNDGILIIAGEHYITEANINDIQLIDDTLIVDDSVTLDDNAELQIILNVLLGIATTEEPTDQIRLDRSGNLLAQILEDANTTKISIDANKVITVKTLITGGVL